MAVEISTDASRLDIDLIHAFLSGRSHWAQGIARTRRSCAGQIRRASAPTSAMPRSA
jgi:hypothetical protein